MTVQMKSALAFMTVTETDWLVTPRTQAQPCTHTLPAPSLSSAPSNADKAL